MSKSNLLQDTLLVGMDFSHGEDVGVLIVGRRRSNGSTEIVNAFQGDEAKKMYLKLVTQNPNVVTDKNEEESGS